MSSSNPGRGKISEAQTSDTRNLLLLDAIPVIEALNPRIVVVENVPQLLNRVVNYMGEDAKVYDLFKEKLGDRYHLYTKVAQMADYGVPHSKELLSDLKSWITLETWCNQLRYSALDARSPELARSKRDPLHFVPDYEGDRYIMVSDIPARSGQSAYQNPCCHTCGRQDVPEKLSHCPFCNSPMRNRPYVEEEDGTFRLIKGFNSSYRRMYPGRPAATITTSSSHIGSDYKIHPWQNRVLSIRECADLQTVPRFYDWSWCLNNDHVYVIRQVIGEALPPWFTYQHGLLLRDLLESKIDPECLMKAC
jgi:DNA (cytosine-5)-methyltransferase 1